MGHSSLEAARAWERPPGLRSLDLHNETVIRAWGNALLVSAHVPQWSYALVMRTAIDVGAVSIDVEVRAGELGLSAVLDDLVTIRDEIPLSSGGRATLVQSLSEGAQRAHVLFRSVDPMDRPLCFVVRALEFARK